MKKIWQEWINVGEDHYQRTSRDGKFKLESKDGILILYALSKKEGIFKPSVKFDICKECLEIVLKEEIKSKNNIKYCSHCYSNLFRVCSECGKETLRGNSRKICINGDSSYICNSCYMVKYFNCRNCGQDFLKKENEVFSISGVSGLYCSTCYNDAIASCQICGQQDYKGRMIRNNGTWYCRECYENKRVIKEYDYTPTFVPHKLKWENTLYMGIEMEIEPREVNKDSFENDAKSVNEFLKEKKLNKVFYFKHDGTVRGFEIVSQPLTLQYMHSNIPFNDIFKWLINKGFTSYKSGACGLHVHLNRSFFSPLEIHKLRLFFSTNQAWIKKFSKRFETGKRPGREGTFFNYENLEPSNYLREGKQQESKYYALRLNPHGKDTIEVRVFRGTLDCKRFIATLQFCDAVAHFTKEISVIAAGKTSCWNEFLDWVRKTNRYEHFIKYISNKEELLKSEI
jgi:hypothetical protein